VARTAQPAPQAPPEPLSSPQTQIQLPNPQPLDPAALVANPEPSQPQQPARSRNSRMARNNTRSEPAAAPPASPPVDAQAPAATPPAEERPRLQPILPPEEVRRIQETIASRNREIHERLSQVRTRQGSAEESMVGRIRSLVSLSDEAAKRGDMTQADALSEKALVLARGLEIGK
jgi:DedD protein